MPKQIVTYLLKPERQIVSLELSEIFHITLDEGRIRITGLAGESKIKIEVAIASDFVEGEAQHIIKYNGTYFFIFLSKVD